MLKPNSSKSNKQLLATQKSHSNSPLFLHLPLTLTTYSFNSLLPLPTDSQLLNFNLNIHLDYLRVSSSDLTEKSFCLLTTILFSKVDVLVINKPWHPDTSMPTSKKYQNRIVSSTGVVLGFTKKAKYRGKNTRYVYDIMIDFTGSYFANLSLLKQLELIYYLNTNWTLKCHRLDVAIDDYTRELFPVGQMIGALLEDNYFGFKVIDDDYLDIIDNKLVGTLGIGSRRSSLFIRIYTKHKYFVRWEAELKQKKAQKLWMDLLISSKSKTNGIQQHKSIHEVLINAAIDRIDFRDKSSSNSFKNATRKRTYRLDFWQDFIDKLSQSINS